MNYKTSKHSHNCPEDATRAQYPLQARVLGALQLGLSYDDLYKINTWELTVMLAIQIDDAANEELCSNKKIGRKATQSDIDML